MFFAYTMHMFWIINIVRVSLCCSSLLLFFKIILFSLFEFASVV